MSEENNTPDPDTASGRSAIADDIQRKEKARLDALEAVDEGADTDDQKLYRYAKSIIKDSDSEVTKRLAIVQSEFLRLDGSVLANASRSSIINGSASTLKLAEKFVDKYEASLVQSETPTLTPQ